MADSAARDGRRTGKLLEVILLFLKIGFTGFGGPAVTIAMMEDEAVTRRKWLTREYFLDMVGATNLIPGPNATEMAIHLGYIRAGWPGFWAAGACFITPAALLTVLFAWAYVRYGALPQVAPFLYGIKPAVLAVIFGALWRLGKTAAKGWRLVVMGLVVTVAGLFGVNELLALFAGGVLGMLWLRAADWRARATGDRSLMLIPVVGGLVAPSASAVLHKAAAAANGLAAAAQRVPLWQLALFFLKVGSVLYGSGYVLVAFLEGGLVSGYGWLTQQQLLDAIAAGQITPGPLLSTSGFIGYLLAGGAGAAVSVTAIFLPSFVFVAALNPLLPHIRRSPWSAAFLDAINICALGLMASVTVKLGRAALTSWPAWVIAALAAVVGLRWKLNSTWLVLGGALMGWALAPWVA